MDFPKIEKNIPIQRAKKRAIQERIDFIKSLSIGDSFVVPKKESYRYVNTFRAADCDYVSRSVNDSTIRFWKIENKNNERS